MKSMTYHGIALVARLCVHLKQTMGNFARFKSTRSKLSFRNRLHQTFLFAKSAKRKITNENPCHLAEVGQTKMKAGIDLPTTSVIVEITNATLPCVGNDSLLLIPKSHFAGFTICNNAA